MPGWLADPQKEAFVKGLVLDMIRLFGPSRCMFASNWHMHGAMANTDVTDNSKDTCTGIPQLYAKFASWVSDMPADVQAQLFVGTAKEFYRI